MKSGITTLAGAILSSFGTLAEGLGREYHYEAGKLIGFGIFVMLIGVAGTITFEIMDRVKDKY